MEPLVRKSLSRQVANALLEEIRRGRWSDQLPGYRQLGDFFGVSRPTIEAALEHLTRERVLLPPSGRLGRRIRDDGKEHAGLDRKRVLFVGAQPLSGLRPLDHQVVVETRQRLSRRGYEAEYIACPAFSQGNPEASLDLLHLTHPGCLWILVSPLHPVVRWAASRGIPALMLGGERRGEIALPCVAMETGEVITDAVRRMISLGHRKIAVCVGSLGEHGRAVGARYTKKAFDEAGLPFHAAWNVPAIPSPSPAAFLKVISRILSDDTRPTAMMVSWFGEAIMVSSFCMNHRIRIPEDLSLMVLELGSFAPWHVPKLSGYLTTAAQYVRHLESWVESRGAILPDGLTRVRPEFSQGETLAPPTAPRFSAAGC